MRIVFAGTPDLAVPSLRALSRAGHEIAAVVTRPDARSGRGKQLVSSPVARAAEEMGIAVLKPEHPRDPGFADQLARLSPGPAPSSRTGDCCRSRCSIWFPTDGSTCTSPCCRHGVAPHRYSGH
ncbi:Hypothetical protein PFR_JS4_882 [Propionibacterium freudenreichii]|uniref:Methionyl-tRNA formyltransferase n=1 Tax=Propionibacterium freudenreichii TaxID=1744 RepID=A0A2C6YIJ6_9ACTN|nr:Hypothetical protein PFR_JS4_882 [Propionibacterium freudenreichii]